MEHKDWKAETVQMWGDKRPSVSLGSDIVLYSDTGYLQLESRSHLSRAMWHVERRLNISWSCIPSPEHTRHGSSWGWGNLELFADSCIHLYLRPGYYM